MHQLKKWTQHHYNQGQHDYRKNFTRARGPHHISNHVPTALNYRPIRRMHPPHTSAQSWLFPYLNFQARIHPIFHGLTGHLSKPALCLLYSSYTVLACSVYLELHLFYLDLVSKLFSSSNISEAFLNFYILNYLDSVIN